MWHQTSNTETRNEKNGIPLWLPRYPFSWTPGIFYPSILIRLDNPLLLTCHFHVGAVQGTNGSFTSIIRPTYLIPFMGAQDVSSILPFPHQWPTLTAKCCPFMEIPWLTLFPDTLAWILVWWKSKGWMSVFFPDIIILFFYCSSSYSAIYFRLPRLPFHTRAGHAPHALFLDNQLRGHLTSLVDYVDSCFQFAWTWSLETCFYKCAANDLRVNSAWWGVVMIFIISFIVLFGVGWFGLFSHVFIFIFVS